MYEGLIAETITIEGNDGGTQIDAYLRPPPWVPGRTPA